MLLLLAGCAALLGRLPRRVPSAVGAAQGVLALAAAIYTVNQAVDGVAVRHVAEAYVASPAQVRPAALLVADAVRHLEIGLTSSFRALLGVALLLTAAAVRRGIRSFAVVSAAVGVGWLVLAADVATNGFERAGPTSVAALALVVWVVVLSVLARSAPHLRTSRGWSLD